MRRVQKLPESKILTNHIRYISGNSSNNKILLACLHQEQKMFCAYTDEFISRTDAMDVEHFNPNLKNTDEDNYNNWFVVKHQWNLEKSIKWEKFQPVLHPTADDFEERIIYYEGDYVVKSSLDEEAKNLITLLKLDDIDLAQKRKKYIARKRRDIEAYNEPPIDYFKTLIKSDSCGVSYTRAIREEFNIDLWDLL